MKSLLLMSMTVATLANETEIQENARMRAKKFSQFITAMKDLEKEDDISELMLRRHFQIPRIRIVNQRDEESEDGYIILSAQDFD